MLFRSARRWRRRLDDGLAAAGHDVTFEVVPVGTIGAYAYDIELMYVSITE